MKCVKKKPKANERNVHMNTVKKGDTSILGKEIRVKTDRPIGSVHPKHNNIIYPINYGYVPNLFAGDGEEQDVYILGVNEPVEEITVTIIAVILRSDDNEDKWVGVPAELLGKDICYECNIKKAVEFQEQFHVSTIDALYEKTCGAVMYTYENGERKYLLITNTSGHIGFPKGHVEYGESEEETAVREVREETGLTARLIDNFRMECSYTNREGHHKNPVYFLSEYDSEVTLQKEEISECFLLPYEQALEKLNYPQDRPVLEAAEKALKSNDNLI